MFHLHHAGGDGKIYRITNENECVNGYVSAEDLDF